MSARCALGPVRARPYARRDPEFPGDDPKMIAPHEPSLVDRDSPRPSYFEELEAVYASLEDELARLAPVCLVSGRCCRFREYGHTLFLSAAELEYLLRRPPSRFAPWMTGRLAPGRMPRAVAPPGRPGPWVAASTFVILPTRRRRPPCPSTSSHASRTSQAATGCRGTMPPCIDTSMIGASRAIFPHPPGLSNPLDAGTGDPDFGPTPPRSEFFS